ncbi:MAG: glycosidase [Sphingomonadaceae bacterium]|nr:glycosidase [Sphingomonadaceae bacterium]
MLRIHQPPLKLRADPSRVVVRPFHLPRTAEEDRTRRIVDEVRAMDMRTARAELAIVQRDFGMRHWQTQKVFLQRFADLAETLGLEPRAVREEKKLLIGAYLCHEYSYAAAALMNPSVTRHPDQSGLAKGSQRFIMSLRAVGEGHISSVAFREGIVCDREIQLMPQPPFATAANSAHPRGEGYEGAVTVRRNDDSTLSGTLLFPVTAAQKNGLEDLRVTRFTHDDGEIEWIGTYTAYSGREIQSELLRTKDFHEFDLVPIQGKAGRNKGMAPFPRQVNGKYMMIGRQDGENLYLLQSDELERWDDDGIKLMTPRFPWELVQIGNCGAPIELDEGWLVLTHGVGAMRKYSIGAALLAKDDPSKVLGRTFEPILSAADEDREGYVPNVVYTCGAIRVGGDLFMPYGVADSSVAFAFVPIKGLLASM